MSGSKNQIILSRKRFYFLVVSMLALIVLLPVATYWYVQTAATHTRWGAESNYAHLFYIDTSDVAYHMKGNFGPWNNVSGYLGDSELADAETVLNYLGYLDTSHGNQLDRMAMGIYNFRTSTGAFCSLPKYCQNVTSSQLTTWSGQLLTLASKVYNAYNNYENYTNSNFGMGPSVWYLGPGPPDEHDLQDAVTICANLTG